MLNGDPISLINSPFLTSKSRCRMVPILSANHLHASSQPERRIFSVLKPAMLICNWYNIHRLIINFTHTVKHFPRDQFVKLRLACTVVANN